MEKRQGSPEDIAKYGPLPEVQMERRTKVRGLLAFVSTTNDGKKRMRFVNRDFNAAVNIRRCAAMEKRPPQQTRENFVGQPLKVQLYEKKLKPVVGGLPRKAGMRLPVSWRLLVRGAFAATTVHHWRQRFSLDRLLFSLPSSSRSKMNAEPGVPNSDHNRTRQMPGGNTTEQDALADRLLRFLDASPSPYHAVETAKLLLETAGYTELREDCSWLGRVHPGGRYYTTRNESTIVAFRVGRAFHVDAVNGGELRLVGAHTDSPCFRVKPRSRVSDANYEKVAVECYGGGLWYTWFDRDLKCAGRVIWRCASPTDPAQGTSRSTSWQCTLVHVREPILRIPSLAIHLDREVNQGFAPNRQTHLVPVAATALNRTKLPQCQERHATALMGAVIHTLQQDIMPVKEDPMSITRDAGGIVIHDFDLCLADAQPASIGGVQREFIFASRLDNLFSCFAALEALLSLDSEAGVESGAESAVCMVALFDHEECGSGSAQGAASPLVSDLIRRVLACLWTGKTDAGAFEDAVQYTLRRSFLISLDMAHAVHPNYAEKHESGHQPLLGHGPVLKVNANQRYATDGWSAHLLRAVAECCDSPIPLQEYVVRNDMPCGSTIGPIVAAGTGVRTVDVGAPSLSMHSIREIAHVRDLWYTVKLLQAFMRCFGEVRASHNTACVT